MRLKLENFRCFVNHVVELPDNGLVQIQGDNGHGKSTILQAIIYCLYGKLHSRRKITHHDYINEKSRIELDIYEYNIVRTTKPHRLLVTDPSGRITEDTVAQGIIETECIKLTFDEFMASSFILGDKRVSLISMTPCEQIKFVEALAHTKSLEYKTKIKKILEEKKKLGTVTKTTINVLSEQVDKEVSTLIKIHDPNLGNIDEYKTKIADQEEQISKLEKEASILQSKLSSFQAKKKRLSEYKTRLIIVQEQISELESQMENYDLDIINDDLDFYSACLVSLDRDIQQDKILESQIQEKRQFLKLALDHEKNIQSSIEKIEACMGDINYDNLVERVSILKVKIQENKRIRERQREKKMAKIECVKLFDQISRLEPEACEIHKASEMIKFVKARIKEYQQVLSCPQCSCSLIFDRDHLEQTNKIPGSQVRDCTIYYSFLTILEKLIVILQEKIPDIDRDASSEYAQVKATMEKYQTFITELNLQKKRRIPDTISRALTRLENIDPDTIIEDQCELRNYLVEQENYFKSQRLEYEKLVASINSKNKEKKDIKLYIDNLNIGNDPSVKISEIMDQIIVLQQDNNTLIKKCAKIQEYNDYLVSKNRISETKHQISREKKRLASIEQDVISLEKLIKLCKKAEILAMKQTIININKLAKNYIDQMFIDPTNVYISIDKKNSKGKNVQLLTTVSHKNKIYDDINEFSSSEKQRIELSFLLAINDMLDSKILILDEMFGTLDSTTNFQVIDMLKKFVGNKLFLVVSHSCVDGLFDQIISV